MTPALRRAEARDVRPAARLIQEAIPSLEGIIGDRRTAMRAIANCYRAPRTELSARFGLVGEVDGEVVGIAVAFPGRLQGSLKLGTGVMLARSVGPLHLRSLARRARILDRLLPRVNPGDLYVSILAVDPACRRRGVGTSLMERVIRGATRMALGVSLDTAVDEPARRMYERLGFRVVAARETTEPERAILPVSGMVRMQRPLR